MYAEGEINLIGAGIRGDLSCSRGKFSNPGEIALVLDRAEIRGNVHLREKFAAKGQVRLMGAKIHGDLDCRSGLFVNINGDALAAQGATVSGSVFLCEDEGSAFEAKGRVCLDGADIQGDLNCRGSKFQRRVTDLRRRDRRPICMHSKLRVTAEGLENKRGPGENRWRRHPWVPTERDLERSELAGY